MKIWKFEIPIHGFETLMPKGAEVLAAGVQGQSFMVWARVDPTAEQVTWRFPIYGTGHEIDLKHTELPLVGTVFMGPLVFHVFDAGEVSR